MVVRDEDDDMLHFYQKNIDVLTGIIARKKSYLTKLQSKTFTRSKAYIEMEDLCTSCNTELNIVVEDNRETLQDEYSKILETRNANNLNINNEYTPQVSECKSEIKTLMNHLNLMKKQLKYASDEISSTNSKILERKQHLRKLEAERTWKLNEINNEYHQSKKSLDSTLLTRLSSCKKYSQLNVRLRDIESSMSTLRESLIKKHQISIAQTKVSYQDAEEKLKIVQNYYKKLVNRQDAISVPSTYGVHTATLPNPKDTMQPSEESASTATESDATKEETQPPAKRMKLRSGKAEKVS